MCDKGGKAGSDIERRKVLIVKRLEIKGLRRKPSLICVALNMQARSGPHSVAPVMRKAAVGGDKKVDVEVKGKAYIRLLSRQGDITTETFDRDTPSAEK